MVKLHLEPSSDLSSQYKKHPILYYVQDEISRSQLLKEFANKSLNNDTVPQSLTALYSEYFHLYQRKHFAPYIEGDETHDLIRRTIYAIGRIAYREVMRKIYGRVSVTSVHKAISTFNLAADGNKETEDIFKTTRGILDLGKGGQLCTFPDKMIADYVVARYLAEECVRKFSRGRFKISSSAIRFLTGSALVNGEVGRVLFGILGNVPEMETLDAKYDDVFRMQCGLFPILMEACRKGDMARTQITCLAIDCIYENHNIAKLSFFIDDFTKNCEINYTNACFPPHKLPYSLLTLGYFLNVCPQCYGIEMTNFGLNAHNSYYLDLLNNIESQSPYSIVKLNLSRNLVGFRASGRLSAILERSPQISFLDLSDCKIENSGCVDVARMFPRMCLVSLKLSGNHIGDEGLLKSLEFLVFCPMLEILDLSSNLITDESVVRLGEILPRMYKLRRLDLSFNSVGDVGLRSVARRIGAVPSISHIVLQDNLISEEGALALVSSVRRVGRCILEYINLRNNKISKRGQMELQKLTFSCATSPEVLASGQCCLTDWRSPERRDRSPVGREQGGARQANEFESLTNTRRRSQPYEVTVALRRTQTK